MSNRIVEIFPELEFRFFTPSEVAELSGVSPEKQRLWKHRSDNKAFRFDAVTDDAGTRLLHWGQVMQWALVQDLTLHGIKVEQAAFIASDTGVAQMGWHDMRHVGREPLFVFFRLDANSKPAVTMGAGKIDFNTGDDFWQKFGSWIDYSHIQRRVVAIYEANRKSVVA